MSRMLAVLDLIYRVGFSAGDSASVTQSSVTRVKKCPRFSFENLTEREEFPVFYLALATWLIKQYIMYSMYTTVTL